MIEGADDLVGTRPVVDAIDRLTRIVSYWALTTGYVAVIVTLILLVMVTR